tara:strand:- start:13331 stop:13678 length:348 start_codon:yes stop_codon:yes gene_type:complete
MNPVYVWRLVEKKFEGRVDGEIYVPDEISDGQKFSFKLKNIPAALMDNITSALNGAYDRGRDAAPVVEKVVEVIKEVQTKPITGSASKLKQEIFDLRANLEKAQSEIASLRNSEE